MKQSTKILIGVGILLLIGLIVTLVLVLGGNSISDDPQEQVNELKTLLSSKLNGYDLVLAGDMESIEADIRCGSKGTVPEKFKQDHFIMLGGNRVPFKLSSKEKKLINAINKTTSNPNLDINKKDNGKCKGNWLGLHKLALLTRGDGVVEELNSLGYGTTSLYGLKVYNDNLHTYYVYKKKMPGWSRDTNILPAGCTSWYDLYNGTCYVPYVSWDKGQEEYIYVITNEDKNSNNELNNALPGYAQDFTFKAFKANPDDDTDIKQYFVYQTTGSVSSCTGSNCEKYYPDNVYRSVVTEATNNNPKGQWYNPDKTLYDQYSPTILADPNGEVNINETKVKAFSFWAYPNTGDIPDSEPIYYVSSLDVELIDQSLNYPYPREYLWWPRSKIGEKINDDCRNNQDVNTENCSSCTQEIYARGTSDENHCWNICMKTQENLAWACVYSPTFSFTLYPKVKYTPVLTPELYKSKSEAKQGCINKSYLGLCTKEQVNNLPDHTCKCAWVSNSDNTVVMRVETCPGVYDRVGELVCDPADLYEGGAPAYCCS